MIIEAIELPFGLIGGKSVIESLSIQVWTALTGTPATPISPVASAMIIPLGIVLFLIITPAGTRTRDQRIRDVAGITGFIVALVAFTFILSYVYNTPFLYNSALIPMALTSALAGLLTSVGVFTAAGRAAIPLKYFVGSSTRARLLRVFVTLVIILTLVQDVIFYFIADVFQIQNALILSACIVIFIIVTAAVIARFSGRIGRDLDLAEQALMQKNEELGALNEELTAISEELRQNNDELLRNEKALRESQERITFLAGILDKASQPFGVGYPDGKLGIVNRAFEDLTGYSADELRKIDWAGVLTPPEWQESEQKSLINLQRTGNPVRYEKEYIRKDGTRVAIELLVNLVTNEDGSPRYYYSFITDITERRKAEAAILNKNEELNALNEELTATQEELHQNIDELTKAGEALREAQVRTATILEGIADTFYSLDNRWRFTVVNPAAERAPFARPAAELLGRVIWEEFPNIVGTPIHRHYLDALEKRSMEHYTAQSPLNNRWYEVFMQGRAEGVDVYMRDITERKLAEEALRETSQYLENLISYANAPIVVWDPGFRILKFNHAFERLTGRNATEVIGKPLEILFPENFVRSAMDIIRKTTSGGRLDVVEIPILHRNGNVRTVLWNSATLFETDGKTILSTIAQGNDITERKNAEDALKKAHDELEDRIRERTAELSAVMQSLKTERHRLYDVLETLPVYVCLLTEDYHMPFANRYFRETFGESYGRCCYDFLFNLPAPCETCESYTVMKTRAPHHWYWTGPNGRDYDIYDFPFTDTDGSFMILEMGIDVTERNAAEKALLQAHNVLDERVRERTLELAQSNASLRVEIEERGKAQRALLETTQYLENLINYANAPIVVWDPDFVITRFNHAFEELTGWDAREIIGQRLEVLFPQRYLDASMEIIRKTMKGERLRVVEIPVLNRKGEIRIVLWNSATLFEPDGKTIQSTIAQGNDITERKMTEAELEEKNEELNSAIEELTRRGYELNEALNEKEVLLSEVHHRVKNNLTAFISLLSLESAYDDSPSGLALKKDLQNRARSMALIHETLYRTKKYSRVDMEVYLSTLVGQVVSSYESAKSIKTVINARGITLDLSRATPGGLIINELLTNSLKYAFPASFDCEKIRGTPCTIQVSLVEDNGSFNLTVKDNGIGLPGDLDIGTTKTLGLKLVNFLARYQLRATIEVLSQEGTEFRFWFTDKR